MVRIVVVIGNYDQGEKRFSAPRATTIAEKSGLIRFPERR